MTSNINLTRAVCCVFTRYKLMRLIKCVFGIQFYNFITTPYMIIDLSLPIPAKS